MKREEEEGGGRSHSLSVECAWLAFVIVIVGPLSHAIPLMASLSPAPSESPKAKRSASQISSSPFHSTVENEICTEPHSFIALSLSPACSKTISAFLDSFVPKATVSLLLILPLFFFSHFNSLIMIIDNKMAAKSPPNIKAVTET